MPDDQTEAQPGDPAKAFEDLRAEVSVLRKAVEALPRAMRENRPPDYAQDLAVIGKGLDEIGGQLETIQQSPALRLSPEQQGASIANAGRTMISEAADALRRAAQSADHERSNLTYLIGNFRTKQDQRQWLAVAAVIGLLVGFVSFPFVIRAFPFGIPAGMAATIMDADEWDAGIALMKSSSPDSWAQLAAGADLVRANADKIKACRETAAKTKKEERCTITVQSAAGQ